MNQILGWSVFSDKYKPINNNFRNYDCQDFSFEVQSQEFDFVQAQDPRHVWTWVDGDRCSLIVAGLTEENRLSHYVTELPWEDQGVQVLLSKETDCECYSDDTETMAIRNDEYGDPDCERCEGYGMVFEQF